MIEGLTLIDHANNPRCSGSKQVHWHVRDDGWIGPSLSRQAAVPLPREETVTYRYALLVHPDPCSPDQINPIADRFDNRRPLKLQKASGHTQWKTVEQG